MLYLDDQSPAKELRYLSAFYRPALGMKFPSEVPKMAFFDCVLRSHAVAASTSSSKSRCQRFRLETR